MVLDLPVKDQRAKLNMRILNRIDFVRNLWYPDKPAALSDGTNRSKKGVRPAGTPLSLEDARRIDAPAGGAGDAGQRHSQGFGV